MIAYTMLQLLLAACVSLTSSAGTVSTSPFIPVPCHVTKDSTYHGVSVNCTHRGITSLPLPEQWFPPSVTSLLLDYNSISQLNNKSFSFLTVSRTSLRFLTLRYNEIDSIAPSVFYGFDSLTTLDLSFNKINLDRGSINERVFHGLGNLQRLDVGYNEMKEKRGRYPDDLFRDLRNLTSLSIETFSGDLNFGMLFNTTEKLSILSLSGGMFRIRNNSFESFSDSDIHLKELIIHDASYLHTTEIDAFRYFTFLDAYSHTGSTSEDLTVILESVAPFSGKNMSRMYIEGLHMNYDSPNMFTHNTILTQYMARFLTQICIEDLSMLGCYIFMIDPAVLSNGVWRRCLKNLDLSRNPLTGYRIAVFAFALLPYLEHFAMTDRKYVFSHGITSQRWRPPTCLSTVQSSSPYLKKGADEAYMDNVSSTNPSNLIHKSVSKAVRDQRSEAFWHFGVDGEQLKERQSVRFIRVFLPKQLKILNMNGFSYKLMQLDKDTMIINGEHVDEVHLADNGITQFTQSLHGLTHLKLLDVSRNDGSLMSPTIFNDMPTIMYLNMADMKLNSAFMAYYSSQLFKSLTELITLDISKNDLHQLTTGCFATNNKLSVLGLADNRFQDIPFDLQLTPRLCYLDMRGNSLQTISEEDIASLERHAGVVNTFSLKLDGNEFYCGCKSIKFLSWLHRTQIDLDNNRNYTCISDSGIRQSTGQIKDLEAMWRLCHGEKALWISLILSCLLILGFMCFIMIPKLKTQHAAFILRTFRAQFMMKTSVDYPIGVYICYADQDMELACQRLRHFVEERLHLSTYVRHRDLLPASDIAESIVENVHASWRVLLVVSRHFLNDPWSYFLLKASPYAVQVENPGLIVLVIIDDNPEAIWSQFPNGFLQTVLEDNIITMTPNGNISYEDKEALKTALLH